MVVCQRVICVVHVIVSVWQRVLGILRVLFGGFAACHRYGVCNVWWCVRVTYVSCVYCVFVWQRVIGMVRVMCGGVAACYKYGACIVW